MLKNRLNYKLLNILIFMVILYLVFQTSSYWGGFLGKLLGVCFPFLLAFVVAYVLDPFVKWLEGKGVRRKLAIVIVLLVVIAAIVAILWISIPLVYEQLLAFTKSIVGFLQDISTRFDVNLGDIQIKITDVLNNLIQEVGAYISTGTIDILGKSINVVTNICIVSIVSIYLLFDMEKIRSHTKHFLQKFSKRTYLFVKKLDTEMGNYFHGLFLLMIVTFFEYSIVYRIVGHPNWIIIGVLMAILTIVPYFGGIIGNIIAMITAWTVSTPLFIASVIITAVFSNIDGYIISPKIYGKTNNINPLAIILSVAIGGALFGPIGVAMSLPLYIALHCAYDFYEKDIRVKIGDMIDEK